jgi:NAD(P)-dependent dehydrogenase (short-subunit alcohol dehydrogenase family)
MQASRLFDIAGQVGFVTGAGSGLGLAYAEVLAENGAWVMLTDIDEAALDAAAIRLRRAGCTVETRVVDVTDSARLRAVIDETMAGWGRLDILFANAGISAGPGFQFGPAGGLANIDEAGWDRVLATNLTASLRAMQYAVPHMKAGKGGRIIVTSSIGGIRAEPMVGYAYAASKAAIINVVRQAAVELAPHNILVNAIAPGPFLTNIAGGRLHRDPSAVQSFAETIPLGRLGQPDEIKGLALLLASPAGSFITGAVIPIDGGCTAV